MSNLNYEPIPSEALKLIVDKWGNQTITYNFITERPSYPHGGSYLHPYDPSNSNDDPFQNIADRTDMVDAIEWALRYIGALTGLTFESVSNGAPANIQFGINELDRAPK
jgi:hypothetical protein